MESKRTHPISFLCLAFVACSIFLGSSLAPVAASSKKGKFINPIFYHIFFAVVTLFHYYFLSLGLTQKNIVLTNHFPSEWKNFHPFFPLHIPGNVWFTFKADKKVLSFTSLPFAFSFLCVLFFFLFSSSLSHFLIMRIINLLYIINIYIYELFFWFKFHLLL